MKIGYQTREQIEKIGEISLKLVCLENLDQTIDEIFTYLQTTGSEQTLEELCPYFGVIWPSARALAMALEGLPPAQLRDRKVLEIGCGLGLPSLVAAHLEAQVTATDFHPDVETFIRRNIYINNVLNITYSRVNWEIDQPTLGLYDWVIGSDILYEQKYPEQVSQVVSRHLKPGGQVLLADPGRPYLQNFVDAMSRQGFSSETQILRVPHLTGSSQGQEVFLLRFDRRLN